LLPQERSLASLASAVLKVAFPPHNIGEYATYVSRNVFASIPIIGSHVWRHRPDGGVDGAALLTFLERLNIPIANAAYQPHLVGAVP
jgi:hypothetical protein